MLLASSAVADAPDAVKGKLLSQAIKAAANGDPFQSGSDPLQKILLAPESGFISAGILVSVKQDSAAYEKLLAESPYPKTDAPQKLTLEQLEAIAKLPPMSSKAGLQTHPAMLPLFRDMILQYSGGSYKNTPIHFRLHAPEKYEKGKKYPLVVWLHGIG